MLEELAVGLYSEDAHFGMELVQNADDNDYAAASVVPALAFVIGAASISVLNNEVGFRRATSRELLFVC